MPNVYEYNYHMEVVKLALDVEEAAANKLGALQETDTSILKATGTMGMLLEQFNTALRKAQKEGSSEVEITALMHEGIETFRETIWPELSKRHSEILGDYPSPFPIEYGELDRLKTDEAEAILSRLTYLTNLDASYLKQNAFKCQELIHVISQMTSSMTEFFIINKQNWTKNQRTT